MAKTETTPITGYNYLGESRVFELAGDELLPVGWAETKAEAIGQGTNQAADRELRYRLERKAEAVDLKIEPHWTTEKLAAAVHRAEAKKAAEKPFEPRHAPDPDANKKKTESDERRLAEAAARVPPVGESGADMGQRATRIDQQQRLAAKLLKEDAAVKRADADEQGKPNLSDQQDQREKELAAAKKGG